MYGPEVRVQALAPIDSGHSLRSISMSMGINRSTLREWRDYPEKHVGAGAVPAPRFRTRFSKPNTISVAKRDAVARLDEFVGPKY